MPSRRLVRIREELASLLVTRSPYLCLFGHRAKLPFGVKRFMRSAVKWMIIADMRPPDDKAFEEESRWLKLGDDALHNRGNHSDDDVQLNPGSGAARDFDRDMRELELALNQVHRKNKSVFR